MRMLHLEEPIVMNIKKIYRLMGKFGLKCPIRRSNPYRRMAKALQTGNVADNLLNREFEEHGVRAVLLTHITYIRMKDELDFTRCVTHDDVVRVLDDYMDYYNNDRYQWEHAKLSPREYYAYVTQDE